MKTNSLAAMSTILTVYLSLSTSCPTTPTYCPPHPATHAEQRAIFDAYVQTFYHENITLAMNTYVSANLTQHNPNIRQGRDAQTMAVVPIYKSNDFALQNVLIDGNYGMIYNRLMSKKGMEGSGTDFTYVVDAYRFEGSCLVEHWDVIQDVDGGNSTGSGV